MSPITSRCASTCATSCCRRRCWVAGASPTTSPCWEESAYGFPASSPWRKSDRAEMGAAGPAARREEGEYSAYSTDEQRSRRAGSARFGDGRLLPRAAKAPKARGARGDRAWCFPVRERGAGGDADDRESAGQG